MTTRVAKNLARPWCVRCITAICAVLAGALVAEIGLRIVGVTYPRVWQRDHYRGSAYRPDIAWWQRKEGAGYVEMNHQGFRDENWETLRPPNTVRIAVLGDSYVEAVQLSKEDRMTELLEKALNREHGSSECTTDVMNFGVSGYGTAQELLTLRHEVWQYSPQVVILAVLTGNDIQNNHERLQKDSGRPYFVIRKGRLQLDDSFRRSSGHQKTWAIRNIAYPLIDVSRVAQLAYAARAKVIKAKEHRKASNQTGLDEPGLDSMVYLKPMDPNWRESWRVTEALILQTHEEVKARGARLLVTILSNAIQVHPDVRVRKKFAEQIGVDNLFYPDDRLCDWCRSHGINVLSLVRPFQEYAEEHRVYLHGFPNTALGRGHWNANGHRLAAELIAKRILDLFGERICRQSHRSDS